MSSAFSLYYLFFFKQKTAYEVRISDWSSDVCSSDLAPAWRARRLPVRQFDLRRHAGRGELAARCDAVIRAAGGPRCAGHHLQPFHGAQPNLQGPELRTTGMRSSFFITAFTLLVYVFIFAPIAVLTLLSFNSAQFGSFPMEGFSFRWFIELYNNDAIVRAFKTSMLLGVSTAVIATTLGILACLAIVRYDFRGKETVNTLLVAPVLIPETVLAVGLLLFMQIMHQPRSFLLLLLGHVRSEEHTSELQSLMRISYAVFCLKKQTNERISTRTSMKELNN